MVIGARAPGAKGLDDGYSDGLHAYAQGFPYANQVRVLPVTRDTTPWYALADLMVCASDLESLPRSVLEAMWWETPVVATAIFGLPELIEHHDMERYASECAELLRAVCAPARS